MNKFRKYIGISKYVSCTLVSCNLQHFILSQRLENITSEADTKLNDDEKIHMGTHLEVFMEEYDSAGNGYHELMMCLKKHQLALESVL